MPKNAKLLSIIIDYYRLSALSADYLIVRYRSYRKPVCLKDAKRPRAHTLKGPQPPKAPPKGRITWGTAKRERAGKAGEVTQNK
jgi:hypothetical protein